MDLEEYTHIKIQNAVLYDFDCNIREKTNCVRKTNCVFNAVLELQFHCITV